MWFCTHRPCNRMVRHEISNGDSAMPTGNRSLAFFTVSSREDPLHLVNLLHMFLQLTDQSRLEITATFECTFKWPGITVRVAVFLGCPEVPWNSFTFSTLVPFCTIFGIIQSLSMYSHYVFLDLVGMLRGVVAKFTLVLSLDCLVLVGWTCWPGLQRSKGFCKIIYKSCVTHRSSAAALYIHRLIFPVAAMRKFLNSGVELAGRQQTDSTRFQIFPGYYVTRPLCTDFPGCFQLKFTVENSFILFEDMEVIHTTRAL